MGAREWEHLPADLARGLSRFRAWRGRRKVGSRIPDSLWTLAVGLAQSHGVSRTASVLGLAFYGLKERVEAAGESPAGDRTFVELPAPTVVGKQCLFELSNVSGTTMRVQLLGYDAADVATLSRSFWNAE